MIAANELRIGNWVGSNAPDMIVRAISNGSVELEMPGAEADYFDEDCENLIPIPLTPEILEKCGFTLASDNVYGGYLDGIGFGGCRLRISNNKWWNGLWYVDVKYLHQLQNLYFSLTENEINFTP